MRIREVFFHNFRSFRGEKCISFVDPLTDEVRPMTVIAGTNGTGKTTIMDAIQALLAYLRDPDNPEELIKEAWQSGLVRLALEISASDVLSANGTLGLINDVIHIAVGVRDLARSAEKEWPNLFCRLVQRGVSGKPLVRKSSLAERLRKSVSLMYQREIELCGGLLYFPHDRQLIVSRGGPIEPPPEEIQWIFRLSPSDRWQGSLEQLWVWQNYLDLEQGAYGERRSLLPFVETVENVLGEGRTISIREGRVLVTTPWREEGEGYGQVRLNQLPSGEQQVLLIFGELARRRRRGAVVLIDEIENSLHPSLQRLVMHKLRDFAREWDLQIIVATHSLEVLRTVHESERVILDQLD